LDNGSAALASVILVNIWAGIPFNMVILFGGLQNIPEDRYEAAAIDGAGPWQRFRYITLPLLKPVTLVVLMLGLIYTLRAFDVIYVLTQGGPGNATQTLTTWSYVLTFQDYSIGQGAAVSNLLLVVVIVLGFVYLRTARNTEGSPE
jgi:multiple sugar transport system permease protein